MYICICSIPVVIKSISGDPVQDQVSPANLRSTEIWNYAVCFRQDYLLVLDQI